MASSTCSIRELRRKIAFIKDEQYVDLVMAPVSNRKAGYRHAFLCFEHGHPSFAWFNISILVWTNIDSCWHRIRRHSNS